MLQKKSPARARTLAFLFSGLIDCFFGGILLLSWLKLLPYDLAGLGLSQAWTGLLGTGLSVSGVVVVIFQITKLKEPDE